ncbi:eukaryotic aspartyl protease family protein [Artemisia annua]|uniref:Eukaryotic aspartyl protease family protein n=1 Tax=Artemisia annua TaxID=35608 RepID=A0A2U1LXV1_ARTAN|nr:eukaryotic aspartyl protease family protein [Artemisia annua]
MRYRVFFDQAKGSVCLGVLNGTEVGLQNFNVIGDISMQDKMVIYDNEKQTIGWTPANCDRPPRFKGIEDLDVDNIPTFDVSENNHKVERIKYLGCMALGGVSGLKEKIGFRGLDRLVAAKEALTENVSLSPIHMVEVKITFRFGLPNKTSSYSVHGSALGAKEVDATRQKPYEPFHVPNDVKGYIRSGHGEFKATF